MNTLKNKQNKKKIIKGFLIFITLLIYNAILWLVQDNLDQSWVYGDASKVFLYSFLIALIVIGSYSIFIWIAGVKWKKKPSKISKINVSDVIEIDNQPFKINTIYHYEVIETDDKIKIEMDIDGTWMD